MLSITAKSPNGIPVAAESELFRWRAGSDGMGDGYLSEIATGRAIYQMSRMFRDRMGSEPIADQVTIDAVREFWAQIRIAVEAAQATAEAAERARAAAEEQGRKHPLDAAKAAQWDALYNDGGDGYNPYR